MFHIKEKVTAQIEVKKSKFICILFPLQDDSKIKDIISQLKKEYPAATHYCYGSSINGNCRSNDDGEPSSTAGKPILQQLLNHELDNVLAVVVRYFGGTLLGTAGLVKAYGDAAKQAIAAARLTLPVSMNEYIVSADYSFLNKIEFVLEKNAQIQARNYRDRLSYRYCCAEDISDQLKQATQGQCSIQFIQQVIVEKEI